MSELKNKEKKELVAELATNSEFRNMTIFERSLTKDELKILAEKIRNNIE